MKRLPIHLLYLLLFLLAITNKGEALDAGPIMGFRIGYNLIELNQINNIEIRTEDQISLQLTVGFRIENLRIIGIYENTLEQISIDSYNPLQDSFTVNISYKIGDFEIGGTAICKHPVTSQIDNRVLFYNGGKRFIYVKYYKEF